MPISKDWLNKQIHEAEIDRDNSPEGSFERATAIGKMIAYKTCYAEQTKAPVKNAKKLTILDAEAVFKTYHATVKYYMENEKFIQQYPNVEIRKNEANKIAQLIIKKQKQKILDEEAK